MPVHQRDKNIVKTAMVAATGLGIPGIFNPGLDTVGMAGIWTTMVGAIAAKSGHSVSPNMIAKLVGASVAAVSSYLLGSKILTWVATPLILACPIAGVPAAASVNGFLNGLFTYRLGLTVSNQMAKPNLSQDDLLNLCMAIVPHLIYLPNIDEIREVQNLLTS